MSRRTDSGRRQRSDRHLLAENSADDLKKYQECAKKLDECSKNLLRLCQVSGDLQNLRDEEIERAANEIIKSEEEEARKIAAELLKQKGALNRGGPLTETASSLNSSDAIGKTTHQTTVRSGPFSIFYSEKKNPCRPCGTSNEQYQPSLTKSSTNPNVYSTPTIQRDTTSATSRTIPTPYFRPPLDPEPPSEKPAPVWGAQASQASQPQAVSMTSANTPVHIVITAISNDCSPAGGATQQQGTNREPLYPDFDTIGGGSAHNLYRGPSSLGQQTQVDRGSDAFLNPDDASPSSGIRPTYREILEMILNQRPQDAESLLKGKGFVNCFLQCWQQMSKGTPRNRNKPSKETQCETLLESAIRLARKNEENNPDQALLSPAECLQCIKCALTKTNLKSKCDELFSKKKKGESGLNKSSLMAKCNELISKPKRDGGTAKTFICQPINCFTGDKTKAGKGKNLPPKNQNSSKNAKGCCEEFLRRLKNADKSRFACFGLDDSTRPGASDPYSQNGPTQTSQHFGSAPWKDDPCESFSPDKMLTRMNPRDPNSHHISQHGQYAPQPGQSHVAVDEESDGGTEMDSSILLAIAKAAIELSLEQQNKVGEESECGSGFEELLKTIFDDDPC